MNYEYVEQLVSSAKAGDLKSKENLIAEFTPFINSLSRKTFVHSFENSDIQNECFLTLFTCISKYDITTHRFVAYAINAIKNNINLLIKKSINRNNVDGLFSLTDDFETSLPSQFSTIEEKLCTKDEHNKLSFAIKNKLDNSEKHLISFVFIKNNTLTNYAYHENISYVTASKRKKKVLKKLKNYMTGGNELCKLMI